MSCHGFDVYVDLWRNLHSVIDRALEKEDYNTREYVIEKLNDEFRFLDHLFISNVADKEN